VLSDKLHVHLQVQRDLSNAEIYDILFKDYWEDVKDREHLKLVFLEEAHVILNRKLDSNRANLERFPDEGHKSDAKMFAENAPVEKTIPFDSKGKQNKVNTSLKKNKLNKNTYAGWASQKLIQCLSSLGKDTSKCLNEAEIVGVIMEHVKEAKLFTDKKKISFFCDGKLLPLFRRKKVRCKRIRRFVANHLAANVISEDENSDGSEDDDVPITKNKPCLDGSQNDDGPFMKKKPQNTVELKIAKRVSDKDKRCFASLNENNIKLIYLRRTLVINLLNHLDTFDQKVVGCFVRVKNAPRVHIYEKPKMPYQLGLVTGKKGRLQDFFLIPDGLAFFEFAERAQNVHIRDSCFANISFNLLLEYVITGIKKSSEEYRINDTHTDILLCVTGLWDDVRISMLSDEDILEV
jgi:hypothetical protein